jgi:hypothetical protein
VVTRNEVQIAVTPFKERTVGIAGCRLVAGGSPYRLRDGSATVHLALPVSLMLAEPSLRRWRESQPIDHDTAVLRGYRFIRSYDDAVAYGLV